MMPLASAWTATALYVQFPQARWLVLPGLAAAVAAMVWLRLKGEGAWLALGLFMLAALVWYASLTPRQDRAWADDVARIVTGERRGQILYLDNIRDFRWHSRDQAEAHWTRRQLDLDQIEGLDMVTSVWGNPLIAHLLLSFRFHDQPPLTFSVEIRREQGEKFSALGGFFREFELALIAAEERDILAWRAIARQEDVRLYPLRLPQDQIQGMLLGLVELGNALNAQPRWYNTLSSNCTTVVWALARRLSPDLPLDPSLLLSGKLPAYLDRFDALAGEGGLSEKMDQARISERARLMPQGADFSQWIRKK